MRTGVNVASRLNLRTVLVTSETAIHEMRATALSNNPLFTIRLWPHALPILIVNHPSQAVLFRPS